MEFYRNSQANNLARLEFMEEDSTKRMLGPCMDERKSNGSCSSQYELLLGNVLTVCSHGINGEFQYFEPLYNNRDRYHRRLEEETEGA